MWPHPKVGTGDPNALWNCTWTLNEILTGLHSLNIIKSLGKRYSEATLILSVIFLKHTFNETCKSFKWNCYMSTVTLNGSPRRIFHLWSENYTNRASDYHQQFRAESRGHD